MIRLGTCGGLLLLALLVSHAIPQARTDDKTGDKTDALALGQKLPRGGALRDLRGNRRAVQDFKDNKALALSFVGCDCAVSNLYLPGLIAAQKSYRDKQVQFLAVYPNEREDLDQIAAHSADRDVPFP